jgi:hypothetical protein
VSRVKTPGGVSPLSSGVRAPVQEAPHGATQSSTSFSDSRLFVPIRAYSRFELPLPATPVADSPRATSTCCDLLRAITSSNPHVPKSKPKIKIHKSSESPSISTQHTAISGRNILLRQANPPKQLRTAKRIRFPLYGEQSLQRPQCSIARTTRSATLWP